MMATASPDSPRLISAETREPATLLRRLAALAYDALLLAALLMCFSLLVLLVRGGRAVAPGTLWFQLCVLAIAGIFFGGFWVHGGQTLGMRAWRIRLVTREGGPMTWGRALQRFAAAWLSILPMGLGFWWSLFDPERRCWHDLLTDTRVIRVRAADAAASASARPPQE